MSLIYSLSLTNTVVATIFSEALRKEEERKKEEELVKEEARRKEQELIAEQERVKQAAIELERQKQLEEEEREKQRQREQEDSHVLVHGPYYLYYVYLDF